MKTHQEGPTCWDCINRYQQHAELLRVRANILTRARRLWFAKRATTREERIETYEMLENTAADLMVSIRWIREEQAEHMAQGVA